MDLSSMESAETIPKGKAKIMLGTGNGFNLNHASGISHEEEDTFGTTRNPWVSNGSLAFGLGRSTDLGLRLNLLSHTWGAKVFLKKRLYNSEEGLSFALLGALNATSYSMLSGGFGKYHYNSDDYDSYGSEIQLISTKRIRPDMAFSFILRGNSDLRQAEKKERIKHGGFRLNSSFGEGKTHMLVEGGMEAYQNEKNKLIWMPMLMFGISFQ